MSLATLTEPARTPTSGGLPDERGKPIGTFAGLPLYKTGTAPARLRTRSQLERGLRLRPATGPVCHIKPTWHPDERRALYDPADAIPIPFRSPGDEWAWWSRRTCPRCGERCEYVVHGKQCGACHRADRARAEEIEKRRCSDCRRVGSKPLAYVKIGFYPEKLCRFCVAAKNREKQRLLRAAIRCPGGCGKRAATKREVLSWALANHRAIARWQRWCPPCESAHTAEEERLEGEREVRRAKARAEQEERDRQAREARAREVAELAAWAAAALDDPNVVILDTETTGLEDGARIVDIAVVTGAGDVLLDTLVDPGEPIPAEASAIHGITDAMVAGAPTFAEVLPMLAGAVTGRRVLAYNLGFDEGRLRYEFGLLGVDADGWLAAARWEDAMVPYSDWVGEWSEWHGNYRWQRLNGGHRALGDCLAVIDCLKVMARSVRPEDEEMAA